MNTKIDQQVIEALKAHGCAWPLIDLISEVQTQRAFLLRNADRSAEGHEDSSNISLDSSLGGTVAVYAHKDWLHVVLDRQQATAAQAWGHFQLVGKEGVSTQIRITAKQAEDADLRPRLVGLLLDSMDRNAHRVGHGNQERNDQANVHGETCPVHFLRMPVTGVCELCA